MPVFSAVCQRSRRDTLFLLPDVPPPAAKDFIRRSDVARADDHPSIHAPIAFIFATPSRCSMLSAMQHHARLFLSQAVFRQDIFPIRRHARRRARCSAINEPAFLLPSDRPLPLQTPATDCRRYFAMLLPRCPRCLPMLSFRRSRH